MKNNGIRHIAAILIFIMFSGLFIALMVESAQYSANISASAPTSEAPDPTIDPVPDPTYAPLPDIETELIYVESLSKDDNTRYRLAICERITELFWILAKLDLQDPDYIVKSDEVMTEIIRLQALDNLYLQDFLEMAQMNEGA